MSATLLVTLLQMEVGYTSPLLRVSFFLSLNVLLYLFFIFLMGESNIGAL